MWVADRNVRVDALDGVDDTIVVVTAAGVAVDVAGRDGGVDCDVCEVKVETPGTAETIVGVAGVRTLADTAAGAIRAGAMLCVAGAGRDAVGADVEALGKSLNCCGAGDKDDLEAFG